MRIIELITTGSKLLKEKNIQSHILDSEILLSYIWEFQEENYLLMKKAYIIIQFINLNLLY